MSARRARAGGGKIAHRHQRSWEGNSHTTISTRVLLFDYTKVSLSLSQNSFYLLTLEPTTFAAAPEQRLRTVTLRVCRVSKHVSIALS